MYNDDQETHQWLHIRLHHHSVSHCPGRYIKDQKMYVHKTNWIEISLLVTKDYPSLFPFALITLLTTGLPGINQL